MQKDSENKKSQKDKSQELSPAQKERRDNEALNKQVLADQFKHT